MGKKKILLKKREKPLPNGFKKELNDQQLKAVMHSEGPALVIAGAGSGKTRMLTYRVGYLIHKGVKPNQIVLVTFTKKAAQEMIKRTEKLVGSQAKSIFAGTFHHLANLILRKYGRLMDYNPNFTIMDRSDQNQLMKLIISDFKQKDEETTRWPKPSQLAEIYSKKYNLQKSLKEILDHYFPAYLELGKKIEEMLFNYEQRKKQTNLMDFDDLLKNFLKFLQNNDASKFFRKKIQHLLVDEYQDINALQAEIVREIAEDTKSTVIVGDDAQSIYAFRGGDFKHMLNFPEIFPETKKYRLEINYRSSPQILNLANESIENNKQQFKKKLKAVRENMEKPMMIPCANLEQEAQLICQQILEHRDQGIPLNSQAVLFRSRHNALQLEQELTAQNIPYEMRAGVRFFEQAHIKDLLAYLAIVVNQKDQIQWMRLLTMQPGISNRSAEKIINVFFSKDHPLVDFIFADLPKIMKGKRIRSKALKNLAKIQDIYKKTIINTENNTVMPFEKLPNLSDLLEEFTEFIDPLLQDIYPKNYKDRIQDLIELKNFAAKYNDIREFLADILTQYSIRGESIKKGEIENEEGPIILTTIHQAKGLEWNIVYIINLVEGRLPHSRAIGNPQDEEEERRLFYVACTRAKDYLYLTYPIFLWRYNYDDISGKSRFLEEIQNKKVFDEIELEEE